MIIGGVHTISATPKVLSSDVTPCRAITMRVRSNAVGVVYFGDSSMTGPNDAFGFMEPGESFGYSSFLPASGMRASEIYLIGEAGDLVHWNGWVA